MNITTVWVCDECRDEHDDEWSAQECCPPTISIKYRCGVCHTSNFRSELAEDCCEGLAKEGAAPNLTHAELEALGQQRLELVTE
jgi:hypothetical protein